jgi:hypothetical protein
MPLPLPRGRSPAAVVIFLNHLDAIPRPTREGLQKIFDLTPAEPARCGVAYGASLEGISDATNVTVGTVHNQLASVFLTRDTPVPAS